MSRMTFSILFIAIFGVTGFSQTHSSESARSEVAVKATQSASPGLESILREGSGLEAQLQDTIDVRKTKVGDEVILKTTRSIRQNGGTVIAKGTTLSGRVTEVQRITKENTVSKVGMVFDRMRGKSLDVPINASIVSVATTKVSAGAGDIFSTGTVGSNSASASGSSTSSGGDLLGAVGSTVGSVVHPATKAVGRVAGTATNDVGQTASAALGRVRGFQISSSASGSASSSSTISAQGKDVRIDKGATFQLRVNGSTQN